MAPTQETPITTGTLRERALAADAERQAQYAASQQRRREDDVQRALDAMIVAREPIARTFGIDIDWTPAAETAHGIEIDGLWLKPVALRAGAYALEMAMRCEQCGVVLGGDRATSLAHLGAAWAGGAATMGYHCCKGLTPAQPTDPDELPFNEPPAPTAMERLADALVDLLAERGIYPRCEE